MSTAIRRDPCGTCDLLISHILSQEAPVECVTQMRSLRKRESWDLGNGLLIQEKLKCHHDGEVKSPVLLCMALETRQAGAEAEELWSPHRGNFISCLVPVSHEVIRMHYLQLGVHSLALPSNYQEALK